MIGEEIKKDLEDYNAIELEISELESKIEKIQAEKEILAAVDGSMKNYPYTKVHYKFNAINPKYTDELNKYLDILKERKLTQLIRTNKVEEFLNELPTSRLRLIFEYKYIEQFTWRKIAYILGGTEDSVRKEYERFFEER